MPALRPRQAEDLALRLLARGARTKIVETHTGLSADVLRRLRKALGVAPAANGPIPYPGGGGLACRETQIHRGLCAAAYDRIGGSGVAAHLASDAVIGAHDRYRRAIEGAPAAALPGPDGAEPAVATGAFWDAGVVPQSRRAGGLGAQAPHRVRGRARARHRRSR